MTLRTATITTALLFLFLRILPGQEISFSTLGPEDGLSQSSVTHIIQDSEGIMWFATQVGIDRYDGRNFKSVRNFEKGLLDDCTFLTEFGSKSILTGIGKNIYQINKTTLEWKKVYTLPDSIQNSYIGFFKLKQLLKNSPYVVFTTRQAILLSPDLTSREIIDIKGIPDSIESGQLLHIEDDKFIMGTPEGLYEIDPRDNFQATTIRKDLKVTALYYDNLDSLLYAGLDSILVFVYDRKSDNGEVISLIDKDTDHLPPSHITSLYVERNEPTHKLWVGTATSGLYLFNINIIPGSLIQLDKFMTCHAHCRLHRHVTSNKVACITTSKDGVIWVGTQAGGVNYWQKYKQHFRHHFRGRYLGKGIEEVGGSGKKGKIKDTLYSYNNHALGLLSVDSKKLMIGGEEGVALVDLKNDYITKRWLPADHKRKAYTVSSIIQLNRDSIILGTYSGLYFLNTRDLEKTSTSGDMTKLEYIPIPSPLKDSSISILFFNTITDKWWIASRGRNTVHVLKRNFASSDRITFREKENISFIQQLTTSAGTFTLIGTTEAIYLFPDDGGPEIEHRLKKHITCAVSNSDSTQLWLGTDRKGLLLLNILNGKAIDSITHRNGLEPDVIYALYQDTFANLWMSTNHGIFQINSSRQIINHYTEADNLQGGEFNSGSFTISKDGKTCYFGGIHGVTSFSPKNYIQENVSHSAKLTIHFTYPGLEEDMVYSNISGEKYIRLDRLPDQFNYLEVYFTLPNYHNTGNNQFKATLNNDSTYYAEEGVLRFEQDKFRRIGKNILDINYRSGNGPWSETIRFRINRAYLTFEKMLIAAIIGIILSAVIIVFFIRQKTQKKLSTIQNRINEISRLESREELIEKAKSHLIEDFDYIVFSFVDFFDRRITSRESDCKNSKITNPEVWLGDSDYPIDDRDIIAQVMRKRVSTIVFRNEILNPEIEKEGAFNLKINDQFNHVDLARIYVPIVHRTQKTPAPGTTPDYAEDTGLGTIEVGYKVKPWENPNSRILRKLLHSIFPENSTFGIFFSPIEYLKRKQLQVELYTDNFAQPFYDAILKDTKKNLYESIIDQLENEHLDHFDFIHAVLKKTAEKIGADYGFVAFRTFNNEFIDICDSRNVFYGKDYNQQEIKEYLKKYGREDDKPRGIMHRVVSTQKPYYSNNVKKNKEEFYVQVKEGIWSEMAFPMRDKYNVIYGVFSLSSKKEDYFNVFLRDTIRKIVEKATDIFIKKKESNTLSQLLTPFDIFTRNNDHIYQNAVEALKNYFYSDYISVWERDKSDIQNHKLILSDATSPSVKKAFEKIDYQSNEVDSKLQKTNVEKKIQIVQVAEYGNKYGSKGARIYEICRDLKFQSYIVISIVIEQRIEGFINIFSKRRIDESEISQHSEEFLKNFSKKINMSVQHAQLINSISEISESLSNRHQVNPLQVIVDQAFDLMPSTDSIVLFPYKGKEITLEEIYYAGNLPDIDLKNPEKRANFANYFIEHGTQFQWITSLEENNKISRTIKPKEPNRDTFWKKNNIQSVAAVRLEYNTQPMGVMFFNYKKNFEQIDAKRIINAFTNLATTALINEDFIRQIKEESAKLEKQITALNKIKQGIEKEKKRIEKENRNLEDKMNELLPKAATSSYFLILQGVNHDIRNFLLAMQADLWDIDEYVSGKGKEIVEENIERIDDNVDNINNLLKLFDFRDAKGKEMIKVNELIQNVMAFFTNRDRQVEFKTLFQKNIPNLLCLKAEFSMIIYNLINNAIQAMERKGTIRLTTKYDDKFIIIQIEDNGEGIDNDLFDKIFEFGFTTKGKKGMGIGLFFVKQTIENKMDGTIEVDSYKNKGSRFTIKIPEYINYK